MRTRLVLLTALFVPVLAMGVFFAPRLAALRTRAAGGQLEQPAHWVPFSAKARFVYPQGAVIHGTFYRSSDGSERLDKEASHGQPSTTTIKNIPTATYYVGMRGSPCCEVWASYPMKLPKEGWTPSHTRPIEMSAVDKTRVQWSGFDAYRLSKKSFSRLFVPALNYFDVLTDDPAGRRREYTDIRVGEQEAFLFEPPPGVSIERVNQYNGIVSTDEGG